MSQRSIGKRRRPGPMVWLGVAAVTALVVSACSSSGSSGSTGASGNGATSTSSGSSGKTISVGVIVARTGADPLPGEFEAIDSYFKSMNAHGGIDGYKVNVIGFDSQGSPQTNSADATQLIQQDHVPVVIDEDELGATAAMPITEKAQVPMVGGYSEPQRFYSPYLFPNAAYYESATATASSKVVAEAGAKKAAIVTINVPTGVAAAGLFVKDLPANGVQVAENVVYPPSQSDWTAYAAKVISSGADTVFNIGTEAGGVGLLKALEQQGWKGKKYYFPELEPGLAAMTGSYGNGLVITTSALLTLPANNTEVAAVKQYYPGVDPTQSLAIDGWTDAEIVGQAIKSLGSKAPTAASLQAALQSIKGWSGTFTPPITYGPGNHTNPSQCIQVQEQENGQFTIFNNQRSVCWSGSIAPANPGS
jgi:ABC-type branched-subunit amino acid transport system substrate-binding protein